MKHSTATVLAIGSILACASAIAVPLTPTSKTAANNLSAKLTLASDKIQPSTDGNVSTLNATYTLSNPTNRNITY